MRAGELIKQKRIEKQISQKELADEFGWWPQSVSNIERGAAPVPAKHARKLAKVLGLNPDELELKVRDEMWSRRTGRRG